MSSLVSASPLPKPLIPAIAPLTDALAPLAWPLIRAATGLMLMPHGAQKLFGWFGGYGLEATAGFFETKLGLVPGLFFALSAGLIEFAGGLLLALGLFTRPVAASVAALMAVAVVQVHLANGFFWTKGGIEYPLLWGLVALAFVLAGGGPLSLDRRIGREV
jgi:putative oxidoreductase